MSKKISLTLTWLKDTVMITILFILALSGGVVKELRSMYTSRGNSAPEFSFSKWFKKNV